MSGYGESMNKSLSNLLSPSKCSSLLSLLPLRCLRSLSGHFLPLRVQEVNRLKQASRVWNETFDEFVRSIGFQVSEFDPRLYIMNEDSHCVFVLVYVNDVLVTGSSPELITRTKNDLKMRFEMNDSGKCTLYLGLSFWMAQMEA